MVVRSPLYRVELSNRGGVVRSWKLKKYFDDQSPSAALDLVNTARRQQLGWPFSLVLPDPQLEAEANSALYQVQETGGNNGGGGKSAPSSGANDSGAHIVTFHWSDGHLDVTKN